MSNMTDYINSLAARSSAAQQQPAPTPADEYRERTRPLTDRLRDLLTTIPPEIIAEGLSLRELQPRLRGRKGRACHHAELADALRALGFTRRRYWKDGRTGFNARWFPVKEG